MVAKAYADTLAEYRQYFRLIGFAIYCRPHEMENYHAFAPLAAEGADGRGE